MRKIVLDWLEKYIDDVTEISVREDKILLYNSNGLKGIIVHQKV
jgi:hypothetical protein|tara:strand:+ start:289 stop:420 length:132 start_codon:yes stop_codon:yes gene_type:complete